MTRGVRFMVGLLLPFLMVVPTIPLLSGRSLVVLGLPIAVFWLFCCIPFTAACLGCCWWLHDRHQPEDERLDASTDAP